MEKQKIYGLAQKSFVLLGIAMALIFLTQMALAAPDQARLGRQLPAQQAEANASHAPSHAPVPSSDAVEVKRADKAVPHHALPTAKVEFSDKTYLSATLAREKSAVRMSRAALRSSGTNPPELLQWAGSILRASERRIDIVRALLAGMGGMNETAYRKAEQELAAQAERIEGHGAGTSFLIFLFPYFRSSLENAVQALMGSGSPNIIELARRTLVSQSGMASDIRIWLQDRLYRKDI